MQFVEVAIVARFNNILKHDIQVSLLLESYTEKNMHVHVWHLVVTFACKLTLLCHFHAIHICLYQLSCYALC
jgi:hypothetical protein